MGTGGEALDLALGLLREPSLRGLLRSRPLPAGVGEVLSIAGGSRDATRAAALRTGLDPAELTEASRFFVQQVLLAEDANAYRVLGVHPDADAGRIRDHHRLLLRWLHPDRSQGEQWESAFATRINQAWNQVRSEGARAEYDRSLADAPASAQAVEPLAARPWRPLPAAVLAPEEPPRGSARGPLAVAAVAVACVLLAWLVMRDDGGPPELALATPRPASAPVVQDAPASSPERQALAVAVPSPVVEKPEPVIFFADEDGAESRLADRAAQAAVATVITPLPPPQPVREIEFAPAARPAAAKAELQPQVPPQPQPVTANVALVAPAPSMPTSMPTPTPTPIALAPTQPLAAPEPPAPAPIPDTTDPLQLLQEAHAAVDGLTAWLVAADPAAAPATVDAPTDHVAADIRQGIRERMGDARGGRARLEFDAPHWRLESHQASVAGAYRLSERGRTRETGRMRIELARRAGQWRIAGLALQAQPAEAAP